MNLDTIRQIEEGQRFLINGEVHLCNSATGYMVNDSKNFRFKPTNHPTPHKQNVEYYLPDVCLLEEIQNGNITLEILQGNAVQLSMFDLK